MNRIFLETRVFRLSDDEEIMTLAFFVLIQYRSVTDRRTDGQTDGHSSSGYTSACIACYANALVKILATGLRCMPAYITVDQMQSKIGVRLYNANRPMCLSDLISP